MNYGLTIYIKTGEKAASTQVNHRLDIFIKEEVEEMAASKRVNPRLDIEKKDTIATSKLVNHRLNIKKKRTKYQNQSETLT